MWLRSLILMFAVGCAGVDDATVSDTADDLSGPVSDMTARKGNAGCTAFLQVASCLVLVNNIPITVIVTKNNIVTNNDLSYLVNTLNNVSILDKNETNISKILSDLAVAASVIGSATACQGTILCLTKP
jgi:hypothetical protein